MRMTTRVWARFESKGRPQSTVTMQGSNREIVLAFARWLGDTYMGSHIKLTIARSELELDQVTRNSKLALDGNMADELESLLGQGELLDGHDEPAPHMPPED